MFTLKHLLTSKIRALVQKMSSSAVNPNSIANDPPLQYNVIAQCKTTKARTGIMTLRHGNVDTPVFMPVGTQVGIESILQLIVFIIPLTSLISGHLEGTTSWAVV